MATKTNATLGLSNAELDAELLSELPEREEMSGCHHWHSCWHPCYDFSYSYPPCYTYPPFETVTTNFSSVASFSQVIR